MTNLEFSNEFDILYNNIMSNQAPGLNEYEKSVFLTKAQDEIIKNYFNPKGNKYQEGFDGSAKRQVDFSSLMKTIEISPTEFISSVHSYATGTYFYFPEDLFLPINEFVEVYRNNKYMMLIVVPITHAEYMIAMSKPYKRPIKSQAWRLIISGKDITYAVHPSNEAIIDLLIQQTSITESSKDAFLENALGKNLEFEIRTDKSDQGLIYYVQNDNTYYLTTDGRTFSMDISKAFWIPNGSIAAGFKYLFEKTKNTESVVVELIAGSKDIVNKYIIRYLKKPSPIILEDLEGVTIEDISVETPCTLDEILHHEILQRAVELAKAAYTGDVNTSIEVGKRSE